MDIIRSLVDGTNVQPNLYETFIFDSAQIEKLSDVIDEEIINSFQFNIAHVFQTDLLLFHILEDVQEVLRANANQGRVVYSYYNNYEFPDACVRKSNKSNIYFASVSKGMVDKICDITQGYVMTFKSAFFDFLLKNDMADVFPENLRNNKSYNSLDALSSALSSEECVSKVNFSSFIFEQSYMGLKNSPFEESAFSLPLNMPIMLISDMLRFVWVHEWFHVNRGHFDENFYKEFGLFSEMRSNSTSQFFEEKKSLIRRSLEFDADFYTCHYLLNIVVEGKDTPTQLFNYQGTVEHRAAIMCAAYTLITLYWSKHDINVDINKRSHPTPVSRFYYIRNIFNTFFMNRSIESAKRFTDKFAEFFKLIYIHTSELELIDLSKDKEFLSKRKNKKEEYERSLNLPDAESLEEWWAKISPNFSEAYNLAMDESDEYINFLKKLWG